MRAKNDRPHARGWSTAGAPRPSSPRTVFAEDFSILLMRRRPIRTTRNRITVLH